MSRNKNKESLPKPNKIFSALVGALVACGFFYLLFLIIGYADDKKVALIDSDAVIVNGVIVNTGSKKGSYAVASYFAKGKEYSISQSSPAEDIRKGQKFRVKYYRQDPSIAKILYEQPFFDPTDKIDSGYGVVSVIDKFKIKFSYAVAGILYEKFQRRSKGVDLREGDEFRVYYLVDSPHIAFIQSNIKD
ncbi:MAG: hypothetical protein J0I41_05000 [Filimonas sp.]|nr:hypothetical protein [Filimonas sp.]